LRPGPVEYGRGKGPTVEQAFFEWPGAGWVIVF
jgi:hypothetical protein